MKITFAAAPAYGHVLPLVPLAVAAAEAGHDVELGTGSTFADHLPLSVFSIVPEGMTLHDLEVEAAAQVTDFSDPMAWPTAMFGLVIPRRVTPTLLAHWDLTGTPDVLIYDASNIGAGVAAREVGVPSFAFQVSLSAPVLFMGALRQVAEFPHDVLIDPSPNTWRAEGEGSHERIPIRSVGWSDPRGVLPEILQPRAAGRTTYLTLGTVAFGAVEVLRRSVLETASRCDRVIVAAGPDADLAALGQLPDNVHVERFVDQPRVLERVDLAVHHGGSGTVLGCLAAGVPQIITPQGADQHLNAARLEELGLGAVVRNDAPGGAVAAVVDRLLDDAELSARVEAVALEIAAMPSPESVVATLAHRVSAR